MVQRAMYDWQLVYKQLHYDLPHESDDKAQHQERHRVVFEQEAKHVKRRKRSEGGVPGGGG